MTSVHEDHAGAASGHVLHTPIWVLALRVCQVLISIIVLGLAAHITSAIAFNSTALCIAVVIFTWIIIAYDLLTEKLPNFQQAYHIIAVLALDAFMMIMWLAAWADTAATRAAFRESDYYFKLKKRYYILNDNGLAQLAATAGLGALVWLLFIATFVWTLIMFLGGRKEGRFDFMPKRHTESHQMNPNMQQQPQQPVPQQQAYPVQAQPDGSYAAQAPSQGHYPPQNHIQPTPSPYQQEQSAYPPPQGYPAGGAAQGQDPAYYGQQPYPQSPSPSQPAHQHPASPPQGELDVQPQYGAPQHGQPQHGELEGHGPQGQHASHPNGNNAPPQ